MTYNPENISYEEDEANKWTGEVHKDGREVDASRNKKEQDTETKNGFLRTQEATQSIHNRELLDAEKDPPPSDDAFNRAYLWISTESPETQTSTVEWVNWESVK
jgi:hypothetical protein